MDVKGSGTYRLICGGRSGQLRGLPSSHGVTEVVIGSNWRVKGFLERNKSQAQVSGRLFTRVKLTGLKKITDWS